MSNSYETAQGALDILRGRLYAHAGNVEGFGEALPILVAYLQEAELRALATEIDWRQCPRCLMAWPHVSVTSTVACPRCMTRRIAELEALCGRQRAALTEVNTWFANFGYNRHGIALKDDIPDHAPVVAAIQRALAEEEP